MKQADTPLSRIQQARTELIMAQPFFGVLSLMLRPTEVPRGAMEGNWQNTMGVDGTHLFYDAEFVMAQTLSHLKAVVCHEVLHVACMHTTRMQGREPRKANIAMDFAINPIVQRAGFALPPDALLDSQFNDMTFEAIYDRLPDPPQFPASSFGIVMPATDADGNPLSKSQIQVIENELRIKVMQAAAAAKAAGKMPAFLERLLDDTRQSKADWKDILRRFVTNSLTPTNYTMTRLNRHYMHQGLMMPGLLKRERVGEIVIAIDNSGSIDLVAASQFLAEVKAIFMDVRPEKVHLMICDTHVHHYTIYEDAEEISLKIPYGGGTDLAPPFNKVAEEGIRPLCLIYFTDMEAGQVQDTPSYPVMWARYGHGGSAQSFGEVLDLD